MSFTRFSRKRGRPRSSRSSAIDRGTPEFRRKQAAGLTADTLDILHRSRRLEDNELHEALLFRRLYTIRFGNPHVEAMDLLHVSSTRSSPCDRSGEEGCYRAISEELYSRNLLSPLINTVIFGECGKGEEWLGRLKDALDVFSKARRRESVNSPL